MLARLIAEDETHREYGLVVSEGPDGPVVEVVEGDVGLIPMADTVFRHIREGRRVVLDVHVHRSLAFPSYLDVAAWVLLSSKAQDLYSAEPGVCRPLPGGGLKCMFFRRGDIGSGKVGAAARFFASLFTVTPPPGEVVVGSGGSTILVPHVVASALERMFDYLCRLLGAKPRHVNVALHP